MKILLTEPISNFIPVRAGFYSPPLGILSIAAYLERFHFEVDLLESWTLKYSWKKILKYIKDTNPDIVGITSLTCNAYNAMALAKFIKEINEKTIVVVGGHHFSSAPEESLNICNNIDYIVIGEGELTLLELLQSIQNGKNKKEMKNVDGLAFKIGKEVIKTPARELINNIDDLPYPAYHLLPFLNKYNAPLARTGTLGCIFSRGCDMGCIYCSEYLLWQKKRYRSADKIIEELELLVNKYKTREFSFNDTDFLYDRNRAINFIDKLSSSGLNIKFRIASRADTIIRNGDLLKDMRKIGLIAIAVGIESFSQKNLDLWNKKITLDQIKIMASCIHRERIPVFEGLIMISGYNNKIGKMVREIISKSENLKINMLWCSILTAFPGTQLYKKTVLENKIKIWDYRTYDIFHSTIASVNNHTIRIELVNIFIYILWFYSPLRFIHNILDSERRKFQIFQLLYDIRIIKNSLFTSLKKMFRINNKYLLSIDFFCTKHLLYVNKKTKYPKSIKFWS